MIPLRHIARALVAEKDRRDWRIWSTWGVLEDLIRPKRSSDAWAREIRRLCRAYLRLPRYEDKNVYLRRSSVRQFRAWAAEHPNLVSPEYLHGHGLRPPEEAP